MDTKPTHEQAQLHLQIYDMRREARLREARDWFFKNFFVESLDDWMRIGEDSKRQDLLAFFLALRASDYVPLKLVDLIVRQLSILSRDNVFVCKFTIHGYVLQASKSSY